MHYIADGTFIQVPLLDFSTPVINSYMVTVKNNQIENIRENLLAYVNI